MRLGLGQSPFPVPDRVVDELRHHAHEKSYLPVQGLAELRCAVAEYYRRHEGLEYSPEHVLIGPGSKELMFLLQLVYDGDLVIPAPSWVSYAPQARIAGRKVHWLPTDSATGLGVTPEALEQLCRREPGRARLMILNYPGNPTGTTYDPPQLEAIAEVARRFGVLVLSDEIYGGLHFEGAHISIARYYPEGTIISNGLSKWCGAGGWRIGAWALPEHLDWLLEALAVAASETYTSVSAPVQHAAVAAFSGGPDIDRYLLDSRRILKALMRHIAGRLREVGATVCEPRGGFYVFPNLADCARLQTSAAPATAAELCQVLLQELGVAMLPGSDFGRPAAEHFVRIAGVDFDGGIALEAAAQLAMETTPDAAFLDRYCQPTLTGIDRLCDWLQDSRPIRSGPRIAQDYSTSAPQPSESPGAPTSPITVAPR